MEFPLQPPVTGESMMTPTRIHTSRRDFLQSVVVGGSLAAARPAAAVAPPPVRPHAPETHHPLEQALRRYGSEFGHMTRILPEE